MGLKKDCPRLALTGRAGRGWLGCAGQTGFGWMVWVGIVWAEWVGVDGLALVRI